MGHYHKTALKTLKQTKNIVVPPKKFYNLHNIQFWVLRILPEIWKEFTFKINHKRIDSNEILFSLTMT